MENLNEANAFVPPLSEDHQLSAQMWAKIRHSFALLKISEAEIRAICSVLAAIYHLGVANSVLG